MILWGVLAFIALYLYNKMKNEGKTLSQVIGLNNGNGSTSGSGNNDVVVQEVADDEGLPEQRKFIIAGGGRYAGIAAETRCECEGTGDNAGQWVTLYGDACPCSKSGLKS